MNDTPKLYVAGIGMITSIGADTISTAAAVNAEISGYNASEYDNYAEHPITLANVPDDVFSQFPEGLNEGDHYSDYADRTIKMSLIAIEEALSSLSASQAQHTTQSVIPLILALPEPHRNIKSVDYKRLINNLVEFGKLPLSRELIYRIHTGRAGGIQGLDIALRYLYELNYEFVLLGGSECYLNHPRLDELDADRRLLAPGVKDGFAPGEGAGFLLLTRQPSYALKQDNHIIALHPPGISEEAGHLRASHDQIYRGDGLDQAFKQALKGHKGADIQCIYSSMNGEHYWAKECGVALMRNQAHFHDPITIQHPADCYGDLGVATGPVLIGLAANQLLKQPGPGTHMVYSSSDDSKRAAVRVEKIAQQPNITNS